MTTFCRRGDVKLTLCAVAGAALLSFGAADAFAQDAYSKFRRIDQCNATSSYGWQPAPGYDRPDYDVDPVEGVEITVFEEPPLSNEPEALDRKLNEFAGENQPFNNGIFSVLEAIGR